MRSIALLAALAALSACSGADRVTQPETPLLPLASVSCVASVRDGRVRCGDAPAGADRIFGGQRVNVLVQSSNVAYDSVTEKFGFDVTLQNLLVQRMGSDGTTVAGVKLFFATGPVATAGTGTVTVANPDGTATFTGSSQPYFHYPAAVAPDSTTPAKHWELNVPKTVETFAFNLYVSTPLVPVVVFEMTAAGNRDVYRMGIDGNDLVRLTTSAATDASPAVAQGRVVFVSYRDGNAELYSIPVRGGTEARLTTTAENETDPALSPDGTRLAFARGPSGGITKVYYATAGADSVQRAYPGGSTDAIESTPSWASSTRLAFASSAGGSADVYDLTLGGLPALLTGGAFAETDPAWSPDGTQLAFASNRTGDTELYLYAAANGAVTRLTTRSGTDRAPTWLLDGRLVYTCVQGSTPRLCILDPANPSASTTIPTPYPADHAAGVRY